MMQSISRLTSFSGFYARLANSLRHYNYKNSTIKSTSEIQTPIKLPASEAVACDADLMPLNNLPSDINQILVAHRKKLCTKLKYPEGIYILTEPLISEVSAIVAGSVKNNNSMLFEANPGPCLMTRRLLELGVPKIRVFESKKEFVPYVDKLRQEYPDRLEHHRHDFHSLPTLYFVDRLNGTTNVADLFSGVPEKPWVSDSPLTIFTIFPTFRESNVLRLLLNQITGLKMPYNLGRVELIAFVSEKEHACLTAKPVDGYRKYQPASVFYQIFFDIETIREEPRISLYPPPSKLHQKKKGFSNETYYLVRITPKRSLLKYNEERMRELALFIRQSMVRRTSRVIPTMERFVSGCGPRLIFKGQNIFTEWGDLTPMQVEDLFNEFVSWPEYEGCQFKLQMPDLLLVDPDDEVDSEDSVMGK